MKRTDNFGNVLPEYISIARNKKTKKYKVEYKGKYVGYYLTLDGAKKALKAEKERISLARESTLTPCPNAQTGKKTDNFGNVLPVGISYSTKWRDSERRYRVRYRGKSYGYYPTLEEANKVLTAAKEKTILPKGSTLTPCSNTQLFIPFEKQKLSSIIGFDNQDMKVKVHVFVVNSKPWFIGLEVAKVLEYFKPSVAIELKVDEKDKIFWSELFPEVDTDLVDGTILVNPSGLHNLVFCSLSRRATEFETWVNKEILEPIGWSTKHLQPNNSSLPIQKTLKLCNVTQFEIVKATQEVNNILENLQSSIFSMLREHQNAVLPPTTHQEPILKGVSELAESQGLPITDDNKYLLGLHVKKLIPKLAVPKEGKLKDGTPIKYNCYPDTEMVREVVKSYFYKP